MPKAATSPDYKLSPPSTRSIESPFICGQSKEYTFCAPKKPGGDFYIAVNPDPTFVPSGDVARIRKWFGKARATPKRVYVRPQGIDFPAQSRVYEVTKLLPPFVVSKNGIKKDKLRVGPNCYHTALAAAGYSHLGNRYVDGKEFSYYLERDFAPIWCNKPNRFGQVVVYDDIPLTNYDDGEHAAFNLLGALVFQKGGWARNFPYEVVPIDGAMQAMDRHWVPKGEDRFLPRPKINYDKYKPRCYRKRTKPLQRRTTASARERRWYLPLLRYYSDRIKKASQLEWSEFRDKRIDLLTIENMNKIKNDFSKRVGNVNTRKMLLSIDDDVAEAYLELYSLSWQHQAMVNTYAPLQKGQEQKQLKQLYRDHYVKFDQDFYQELRLYLRLRGLPKKQWRAVEQRVVAKIKTYNPVDYAKYNGSKGIPYFDIVDEAIRAAIGNK